jgi:TetR/AcrR family transcriptional regulator, mexJK operon transcriptional repressor
MLKGDLHLRCLLTKTLRPSDDDKKRLVSRVIAFYLRGMLHVES